MAEKAKKTPIDQKDKVIQKLEAQTRLQGELITEQLKLAEERSAHITELVIALDEALETIEKQAGEISTMRRLLELVPRFSEFEGLAERSFVSLENW